jgi:hypothetical protein
VNPDAMADALVAMARGLIRQSDQGVAPDPDRSARLAELVIDVDHWIRRGGHLPRRWQSGGAQ